MTQIRIVIKTDGAAFRTDSGELALEEVARVVEVAKQQIAGGLQTGLIRDVNGNRAGHWIVDEDTDNDTANDQMLELLEDSPGIGREYRVTGMDGLRNRSTGPFETGSDLPEAKVRDMLEGVIENRGGRLQNRVVAQTDWRNSDGS